MITTQALRNLAGSFNILSRSLTLNNSTGQLCNANSMRVALLLGLVAGANVVQVSPIRVAAIATGFVLSVNTSPLILTYHDLATLVQMEWYAHASTSSVVWVYEVIMNETPPTKKEEV